MVKDTRINIKRNEYSDGTIRITVNEFQYTTKIQKAKAIKFRIWNNKRAKKILKFNKRKKNIIFDLDGTIITSSKVDGKRKFYIRPYLYDVLNYAVKYYNIILFTAAEKRYALSIINKLQKKRGYFSKIFTRDNLIGRVKDVAKLKAGICIKKTLIIDNDQSYFPKKKIINIPTYNIKDEDDYLLYLLIDLMDFQKCKKTNKKIDDYNYLLNFNKLKNSNNIK